MPIEDRTMGSQAFEILRQGVWASLTGGWFYDPHQDVFCNTFHLYLWLFLLCVPFTIYVYFPPTLYLWYGYCILAGAVFAGIKLVNYALHHMYDTTECVQEKVEEEWSGEKREEEGIELDVLNNKQQQSANTFLHDFTGSLTEVGPLVSTDIDSVESEELQKVEAGNIKQTSTIDLKAEVHRKNSSESSDEGPIFEIVTIKTDGNDAEIAGAAALPVRTKPSRQIEQKRNGGNRNMRKLHRQASVDSQEASSMKKLRGGLFTRPEMEMEPSCSATHTPRRHSNFTNGSLCFIPQVSVRENEIKPTGSLELGYIDKNPNQALTSEGGLYFNSSNKGRVRRIRSTALETCCPPPTLSVHPNSVEIIGGNMKNSKNPLPPPSSTLIRNQHLNLCPYYGSEIVYPIAEQSDEHQTSHGPDTDLESLNHNSDTDYEEINQGIRSPLLLRLQHHPESLKKILSINAHHRDNIKDNMNVCSVPEVFHYNSKSDDHERTSATSKDALLDNDNLDNSNSSATPEMQDARADFMTDNELSDKKSHSECSNLSCSNTSVECEDGDQRFSVIVCRGNNVVKLRSSAVNTDVIDSCVDDNKFLDEDCAGPKYLPGDGKDTGAVRKRLATRRVKKKKSSKGKTLGNCSSLIELDLDILFDDENNHLSHCKGTDFRNPDWASTTKVSLEQDVSKVLQETVSRRSAHSLGAIPKKIRSASHPSEDLEKPARYIVKSESDRSGRRRSDREERQFHRNRSMRENKLTQTLKQNENSSVEGLECLVLPNGHNGHQYRGRNNGGNVKHRNEVYHQESSSGSNNELSSLLPTQALFSAFLAARRDGQSMMAYDGMLQRHTQRFSPPRHCRLRRNARVSRRPQNGIRSTINKRMRDTAIATTLSSGHGTHCAKSFNDTSDGSVHCFLDEYGNWVTYTFDEKGLGTANNTTNNLPATSAEDRTNSKAVEVWNNPIDSLSVISDALKVRSSMIPVRIQREDISRRQNESNTTNSTAQYMDEGFLRDMYLINNENEVDMMPRNRFRIIPAADTLNNNFPATTSYYKFKIFPWSYIKVTLDRLKLLALLDRNLTLFETLLSIILGVLVSVLGASLLYFGFYKDLQSFLFCFVIASCQYSLLKSVQPDAASPTHGFNRIIAYSRPIYFSIFSTIVLLLNSKITNEESSEEISIFEYNFNKEEFLIFFRDFFIAIILFFPLSFSLGLFPQINTFLLYLLEQIDMHLFGGNAVSSLSASFYCVFRSTIALIVMFALAYGGLCEPKRSQHILFSVFCACIIASSYHLSRSASDPTIIWNMVKKNIWPPDVYREHRKHLSKEKEKRNCDNNKENKEEKSEVDAKLESKIEKINAKIDEKIDGKLEIKDDDEPGDPLPHKLQKTVNARLKSDVILCSLIALLVFGVHASTVFTVLQPNLSPIMWCVLGVLGFLLHYIVPQLRKQLPWLCIGRPVLRAQEYDHYQVRGPAKIMWFEIVYVYLCFFERNILYPIMFLSVLTEEAPILVTKFEIIQGTFIMVICGLKCLRSTYSNQHFQYLILTFSALLFKYHYGVFQHSFLINFFLMSVVFQKTYELLLKLQFIVTYIAPWQITWGSAFHAFAQPFSVPHSAMLFLQAVISSILSSPLNPFLGSAIFLTSYVRPVKFWERDYNTKRVDHSNTPLSSHLDRNLGADDNNLNSIFYEHLTRSLQHSLCGDLIMGRWGPVNQGDCFVLASDYLNCLVHIIEMGNGLVTFQMRGLEFRGTYCQQREVEAITEGVEENDGCCCCDPGHLPHMLSVNAAFSQRWLAWEVTASKYIIEGYSISDNNAVSMFQSFDLRKIIITYYVKSIIFYTIRSPKLEEWLSLTSIFKGLEPIADKNFVDLDPIFNFNIDEDYDAASGGMTRNMFCHVYNDWISFCVDKNRKNLDTSQNSTLVLLCFALSLLGRRSLATASHNTLSTVEFFLYGLHALFKGDFRITCPRDEWVFTDMDLFKNVVAPGVRMSLKLHQDHFMASEEYEELPALYDAICKHEEELVITHEGDPAWRSAVLSGTPSLLALRHVLDDGTDEYKIIMLNKMYLNFRVIKVNKECVRGLWAGQQQELVYLRNRNPERGSIQNAKQALRNIINSSCDQPIGYPIYVSPLTTSYAETNEQLCSLVGGSISLGKIRNHLLELFRKIRKRCGEGCSSGSSGRDELGMGHEGVYAMTPIAALGHHTAGSQSIDGSHLGGSIGRGSSLSRTSLGGNRGSLASMGKPTSSTLVSLAGLFKEKDERSVSQAPDGQGRGDERNGEGDGEKEMTLHRVRIEDPNLVYDCINLGRRIDVCWPNEYMRARGGRSHWRDWLPETGMEGQVVHKWSPYHKDPSKRSHVDRTILLIQIEDKFVPIAESGVQDLGAEV
nr:pecanex-like protein 1 isoform X1 [Onthophagus taurus]